ncbi:hypothetical protein DESA109040_12550 [Deinococcus saxicola]
MFRSIQPRLIPYRTASVRRLLSRSRAIPLLVRPVATTRALASPLDPSPANAYLACMSRAVFTTMTP